MSQYEALKPITEIVWKIRNGIVCLLQFVQGRRKGKAEEHLEESNPGIKVVQIHILLQGNLFVYSTRCLGNSSGKKEDGVKSNVKGGLLLSAIFGWVHKLR
eukprot:Colp12_sorted_trinity150504_noHs@11190